MDTWTLPQTQIVIVNYEKFGQSDKSDQLVKDILRRKFDCVILDEAHRIKNRNAKSSKNIMKLHNIPMRLCLTGTPAHNVSEDIFNILRFLKPSTYTSYWKWLDKWFRFKEIYTAHGVVRSPDGIKPELQQAFADELSKFCTMRKRADVIDWDTEVDVIDIPLPVGKLQLKALKELRDTFSCGDVECVGVLDRIARYRQLCNVPELVGVRAKSQKVEWIKEYVKDNPECSTIVFSNSRRSLDYLFDKLTNAKLITGKTPTKLRAQYVDEFQAGKIKILLCQTQACKEGLTLDTADTEIFMDVYPPQADFLQAKDRFVATTAEKVKPKQCYRLYMKGTFDEHCVHMVDSNILSTDVINNFRNYVGEC